MKYDGSQDNRGSYGMPPQPRYSNNDYSHGGGPRPPIPSGYPAHALPGNPSRFGYQQPQQHAPQHGGYPPRGFAYGPQQPHQPHGGPGTHPPPPRMMNNAGQFYPGDNSGNQFYPQQQQHSNYPQQQCYQGNPQQQQPIYYQQHQNQQGYQYQSTPSLANSNVRPQGFQQQQQIHSSAPPQPPMINNQYYQAAASAQQSQQFQQQQQYGHSNMPEQQQHMNSNQLSTQQSHYSGGYNNQQQPAMQPMMMMHSNNMNSNNQRANFQRSPPIRTGFRNPVPYHHHHHQQGHFQHNIRHQRPTPPPQFGSNLMSGTNSLHPQEQQQQQQSIQHQQNNIRPEVPLPPQQHLQPNSESSQVEEKVVPMVVATNTIASVSKTPDMMIQKTVSEETIPISSTTTSTTSVNTVFKSDDDSSNRLVPSTTSATTIAGNSETVTSAAEEVKSSVMMLEQKPMINNQTPLVEPSLPPQVFPSPIVPSEIMMKQSTNVIVIPWGWKRNLISDQIFYMSPSGIELKSKEEIKEYLLKEGTCKCGLECPLDLDLVFDFDIHKQPQLPPLTLAPPNPAKYCSHRESVAAFGNMLNHQQQQQSWGAGPASGLPSTIIQHKHEPATGKKGANKKRTRKKRPYSGILTQQMIEAREAERRRINEIISQQKQEYEAQMSIGFNKKSTAMDITKPAPVPIPINANTQVGQQPTNIVVQKKQPTSITTPASDPELPKLEPITSDALNENKNIATASSSKVIDHSKNIEIRRMSATDDGDKVLESAWDSPEKETKTPLQMVQSIVSKIEDVKPPCSSARAAVVKTQQQPSVATAPPPSTSNQAQQQPPAWTQGTGQRPLLHSQKQVVNDTPPSSKPLPNLVPPQQRNTRQNTSVPPPPSLLQNNVTTILAPAPAPAAAHFVPAGGQHVMQLVNTINGPMLMQAAIPQPIATVPAAEVQDTKLMQQGSSIGKGSSSKKSSSNQVEQHQLNTPTAIQYQTQVLPTAAAAGGTGGAAMPILVSPNTMMATAGHQQASPTGPAQHVLIAGHPGMIQGTPQFVLNQPTMIAHPNQVFLSSNGTLVAMPAPAPPQGVIYNQLPDGTLVQVQSPTMSHHPHFQPQTILTAANGQQVMINSATGQQLSPNATGHHPGQIQFQAAPHSAGVGGTYIMTPSGLVQTSPVPVQQAPVTATTPVATTATSAPPPSGGMIQTSNTQLEPQPGPSSATKFRKESTTTTDKSEDTDDEDEDSDDDDDRDDNESIGNVQLVLQMDEDSSEDELVPLAKKAKVSPTSSTGIFSSSSSKNKTGGANSNIGILLPKQNTTKNSKSPKTYIQSNKVDSSGLQATPPHPADESESTTTTMSGRLHTSKLSSPDRVTTTTTKDHPDVLDTSAGSTDTSSSGRSPTKNKRKKRHAEAELLKDDISHASVNASAGVGIETDDDSDADDETVKSSSKYTKQFSVGELVWGPHGTFPSWPGKLVRFERDGSKVLVCWFGNRDTSQVNPHYLKSLSDGLEAHHRERKKLRKGRKMNASLEKAIQEAMMELDRMSADD